MVPAMMAPPESYRRPKRAVCTRQASNAVLSPGHLSWVPRAPGLGHWDFTLPALAQGLCQETALWCLGWSGDSEGFCGLYDRRRLWGAGGELPGSNTTLPPWDARSRGSTGEIPRDPRPGLCKLLGVDSVLQVEIVTNEVATLAERTTHPMCLFHACKALSLQKDSMAAPRATMVQGQSRWEGLGAEDTCFCM